MIDRVHQWIGNAFYRKISPSEIKEMTFHELKYWSNWHDLFNKTVADEMERQRILAGLKNG